MLLTISTTDEIVDIIDMSSVICEQRPNIGDWERGTLATPEEGVYHPASELAAINIGLDDHPR